MGLFFAYRLFFYLLFLLSVLPVLVHNLILVSIPVLSIQFLAVRCCYSHHAISPTKIHQTYTLGGSASNRDGTYIGTNDNASCRDNHQVIIFLADHSSCCNSSSLFRDL